MSKALKFLHLLGFVMFLGSILTYIVVALAAEQASLEGLVFARRLISRGILVLTLPGLWLIVATGVPLTLRGYGFLRHRWLNFKQTAMLVVVLNAHLVIVPTAGVALRAAEASAAQGVVLPEYRSAYLRESVFGAVNVLLVVASAAAGVWKFRKRQRAATAAGGGSRAGRDGS